MPDKILPTELGRGQNNISPIRIEKIETPGKPPGFYKAMVLDAIGIVTAFFAGCAYFKFFDGSWPLIAPICAFFLFAVALTLEAILTGKPARRFGVLVVEVIALIAPFYAFDPRILAGAAFAALIFFFAGHLQCRGELNHGTTIRFFRATHGIMAKAVTGALLGAIILYLPLASTGRVFVSESEFGGFFNWAAGLIGNFYPAVSLTGSLDNFVQGIAKGELAGNAAFTSLSASDQNTAIADASSQIEANLSKSFGVALSGASPVSDAAYQTIVSMLREWSTRFSAWFMAGWAVALFLVLRGIGVVAVWIGQFLAMIAYELLLAAGVIRIAEEPQTKEVIGF
jgi:hypothetical protein